MAVLRINHHRLAILVTTLAVLLAIAYLALPTTVTFYTSTAITPRKMAAESNPLERLTLTLSQTSTSPPTVRVTVTNENDGPVTIITYNSPLDSIALALGLLTITPDGAEEPLELQTIRASRIWPPKADSLVEVEAEASVTNDLVLKEPTVPMDKLGRKATVFLQGSWMGVFARSKDKVSTDALENMASQPDAFKGVFKSESIEITIE